jgi:predicted site-specific integrase-resolvase
MKTLQKYASDHGIKYRAAWNRYKAGLIPSAFKDEFGKILIPEDVPDRPTKAAVYARVSSSQNRANLDTQAERLCQFANARGISVSKVVKECGSGLNDSRKKLLSLLRDTELTHIFVEHKDRLTRFGFQYLQEIADMRGIQIVIANPACGDKEDLMQDFVSIVTSYCARLYGLRRSRRSTEQLIKGLGEAS